MNCEETRQCFIDLIYPEEESREGVPAGFREHFVHCETCSGEYLRLLETRRMLGLWRDEEPSRRLVFAGKPVARSTGKWRVWASWRPAPSLALAFTLVLVFLALVRIHVSWENGRFSFQSGLFFTTTSSLSESSVQPARTDLFQAVDKMLSESEQRQNQQTLMLMQRMYDNLELKRQMDIYQVRDDLGSMHQNYHQALEKNSVLLEQAAKALKQTRY